MNQFREPNWRIWSSYQTFAWAGQKGWILFFASGRSLGKWMTFNLTSRSFAPMCIGIVRDVWFTVWTMWRTENPMRWSVYQKWSVSIEKTGCSKSAEVYDYSRRSSLLAIVSTNESLSMTVHFKLDPDALSPNSFRRDSQLSCDEYSVNDLVMSLHNLTGSLLSLTLDSFLSYSYFNMTINEFKWV